MRTSIPQNFIQSDANSTPTKGHRKTFNVVSLFITSTKNVKKAKPLKYLILSFSISKGCCQNAYFFSFFQWYQQTSNESKLPRKDLERVKSEAFIYRCFLFSSESNCIYRIRILFVLGIREKLKRGFKIWACCSDTSIIQYKKTWLADDQEHSVQTTFSMSTPSL